MGGGKIQKIAKTITETAKNDHTLNAGNINVNAGKNVSQVAGQGIKYVMNSPVQTQPQKEKCLCNRPITAADLQAFGLPGAHADYAGDLIAMMGNYNINTCLRVAHVMTQVKHESANFSAKVEKWGPTDAQNKYEGNVKELGNTEKGDGKKFLGRGLIQITGRANYAKYGRYLDKQNDNNESDQDDEDTITFEDSLTISPEQMAEAPYYADSVGWVFSVDKGLNSYADNDDLIYISYRINGGFNGFNDRLANMKANIATVKKCNNLTDDVKANLGTYDLSRSAANSNTLASYKYLMANDIGQTGDDILKSTDQYLKSAKNAVSENEKKAKSATEAALHSKNPKVIAQDNKLAAQYQGLADTYSDHMEDVEDLREQNNFPRMAD